MSHFKYILAVALFAVGYQLVLSFSVWSIVSRNHTIDTFGAANTIFQTEAKMAVYQTPIISYVNKISHTDQVVILGASSTELGFRPKELSPLIGNLPVHNIAVGGQNLTSCREIIDLVLTQMPPQDRSKLIFVVGLWYGSFVGDDRRWPTGLTDIDTELLRFGLYKQVGRTVVQRLPSAYLSPALIGVWPLITPYALYSWMGRRLTPEHLPAGVVLPWADAAILNKIEDPKIEGRKQMEGAEHYMGTEQEQTTRGFEDLVKLARQLSDVGAKLVVVDLPLPNWHSSASSAFAVYQERKKPYFAEIQEMPGVHYLDIQNRFGDNDFFDSVHPRPKFTVDWSGLVAKAINEALAPSRVSETTH